MAIIAAGMLAIGIAFFADRLGLGHGGLGSKQIALAGAGILGAAAGLLIATGWEQPVRLGLRRFVRGLLAMQQPEPPILLVALWLGLWTGVLQTLILLWRQYAERNPPGITVDYPWLTPLAYILLFVLIGLAFQAAASVRPQRAIKNAAYFVLAFLAVSTLLYVLVRIHWIAVVLLAAGLALQFVHFANSRRQAFTSIIRFGVGWPALIFRKRTASEPTTAGITEPTRRDFLVGAGAGVVMVAAGMRGGRLLRESYTLARAPRPTPGLPNVLLIVLDTVRAQSLSLYNSSLSTTPTLARLAETSTVFDMAVATAPWTLPSHASMFTGCLPRQLSVGWWTPLDGQRLTLAEALAKRGYATAGFVANTLYCSREFGLHRGFAHYEDYEVMPGQFVASTAFGKAAMEHFDFVPEEFGRKTAPMISASFLRWLGHAPDRPFFAFLNYYDAHAPYITPNAPESVYQDKRTYHRLLHEKQPPAQTVKELRTAYESGINYLDQQLVTLFSELEKQRRLDNTLVIIVGDHGEEFVEHGILGHGRSVYLPVLHVPLLMRLPGLVPQGHRVGAPVSLRHIPATIMDLLFEGEQARLPQAEFPGESLASTWKPGATSDAWTARPNISQVEYLTEVPDWEPLGRGSLTSVVLNDLHYITNLRTGEEELYNFREDPGEQTNILTQAAEETLQRLRSFAA